MALMRHLMIDKFSVIGVSGGAPYAMSCAYCLREQIVKMGIVCGLGSFGDNAAVEHLRKPFALMIKLYSV